MSPRDLFFILVAIVLFMAVARWRSRSGPRVKRERRDTLDEQIASDFPPIYHDEAKRLVESVLTYARPDDREMVWRRVLDGARCDIDRLRKVTRNAGPQLQKIYRLFGNTGGDGSNDDAARA